MTVLFIEHHIGEGKYRSLNAHELLGQGDLKDQDRLRAAINRHEAQVKAANRRRNNSPDIEALENRPLIRCYCCRERLFMRRNSRQNDVETLGYHFAHAKTNDPALLRCPQRSESGALNPKLLRALKYNGAHESDLHHTMKHLIAEALHTDQDIDNKTILIENRLKGEGEYRRPDVQAIHNERLIAFEVQVSTEFAQVIAAREAFYESYGHILWILPSFNEDRILQSQRDILTSNRDHLFVLDEARIKLTREHGRLHLQAVIHWPTLQDGRLVRVWKRETCTLNDISFIDGHAQIVDVLAEEARINQLLEKKEAETPQNYDLTSDYNQNEHASLDDMLGQLEAVAHQLADGQIQTQLSYILASYHDEPNSKPQIDLTTLWLKLYGVELTDCDCNHVVIKALICASAGRRDFNYSSWKYIADIRLKSHPKWFRVFYKVLELTGQAEALKELNSDKERAKKIAEALVITNSTDRLTKMERDLAVMLAPQLLHFEKLTTKYSGIVPRSPGRLQFTYSIENVGARGRASIRPNSMQCLEEFIGDRSLISEDQLLLALRRSINSGRDLPLPNIPYTSIGNTLSISLSFEQCVEFLPYWNEQVASLQETLGMVFYL